MCTTQDQTMTITSSLVFLMITGCMSNEALVTTDAGADLAPPADATPAADAQRVDGGPPFPVLSALDDEGEAVVADLRCLGSRRWPALGAHQPFALPVVPFGAPPTARVPGAAVQFFSSGAPSVDGSCPAPACRELSADAGGIISSSWPDGVVLTYRVKPIEDADQTKSFMQTVEFNLLLQQGGRAEGINTMSRAVLAALASSASVAVDERKGVLAGALRDCVGRPLRGAVVRLFDSAGDELTGVDGGPGVFYFNGEVRPGLDPSQRHTSTDGRYAVTNLAPGDLRVELWGVVEEGKPPRLVACEAAASYPDTLSISALLPLRADAPPACGSQPLQD